MNQLRQIHRSSIKISDQDQDQILPFQLHKKQSKFWQIHPKKLYVILFVLIIILSYLLLKSSSCDREFKVSVDSNNHFITMLRKFQHDPNCYTQGLSFINHTHILQSCGLYKSSYIQILQYNTSRYPNTITRVLKTDFFQTSFFAQGSVFFPKNGLIYMLTWREHKVLILQSRQGQLRQKKSLEWIYEGWGLTHDNQNLIISDGSPNLFVTDEELNIIKIIKVKDLQGNPISFLNELQFVEYSDGRKYIYANVYLTKKIIKLNYITQKVEQIYDFNDIALQQTRLKPDQVLNGIAYDKSTSTFLLTGKKWQKFYVVKGI